MASRKKRPLWIDEVKQQATSGTPYANKREEREAQNTPTQRAVHAVARGTGSQTTSTGRTGTAQNGVQVLQAAQAALNKNNSPYAPVTVPKIPLAGQTQTLPDALKPGTGKVMTPQARLALAGDVEKRRKEHNEQAADKAFGNDALGKEMRQELKTRKESESVTLGDFLSDPLYAASAKLGALGYDIQGVGRMLFNSEKHKEHEARRAAYNEAMEAPEKPNTTTALQGMVEKGGDQFASGYAGLANLVLGAPFRAAGAEDNPFSRFNEAVQATQEADRIGYAKNMEHAGTVAKKAEEIGTQAVAAVPDMVLAYLTAGSSVAGRGAMAGGASRLAGREAALAGAESTSKLAGKTALARQVARSSARNPQYWTAFAQSSGHSYNEAKASGATDWEASMYALINGTLNAQVEVGSGMQTLPAELQKGGSALLAYLRSAAEEGNEEVVQGAVERALQNLTYGAGNPLFPTKSKESGTRSQITPDILSKSNRSELEKLGAGGNVDLATRPVIDSKLLGDAGWDAGGGLATIYTSTFTDESERTAMNFTPIAVNRNGAVIKILSPRELQKYAEGVIAGTQDDYLHLKVGATFYGNDAISQAEKAAERIHEIHETAVYGNDGRTAIFDPVTAAKEWGSGAAVSAILGAPGSVRQGVQNVRADRDAVPEAAEEAARQRRIAAADAARARRDALFGTDAETLADMQTRQNRTESPVTGAEPQGGNLLADAQTALTQSETGQNEAEERIATQQAARNDNAGETFAPEDHIDNRTDDYIAKRSTKPFQHEHPELHDNFVAVAREMQALLNASVESDHPGKKGGTVAWYPEAIRKLTESTGVSRPKLMGVLQDIIDNHGSEDYATAKRVEKVLDELLTKGYEGYGRRRVPPDDNYLAKKDKINGAFDRNSFKAFMDENWMRTLEGDTEEQLKAEWEALQAQRAAEASEAGANVPQTVPADSNGLPEGQGAASAGFDPYSAWQNESDSFHREGEKAARPVELPTENRDGLRTMKGGQTVMEAAQTPTERADQLAGVYVDGVLAYTPVKNSELAQSAEAKIERDGWEKSLRDWTAEVRNGKLDNELLAMGATLLNNAGNSGMDARSYLDLASDYVELAHRAGQALQASRILKGLTPSARLYMMQRSIYSIAEEAGIDDAEINPELAERYMRAETDAERDAVVGEIQADIASRMKATAMDKWTALRYTNMLGNFKTQVRNLTGNATMGLEAAIRRRMDAVLGRAGQIVTGGRHQREVSAFYAPSLFGAAWQDFENVKSYAKGESKFSDIGGQFQANDFLRGINDRKRVFKFAPLEWYRKGTKWAMEKGDDIFIRMTYADAMAQYLNAHGVKNGEALRGGLSEELLDAARTYAAKEAQEATFHDTNAFSSWASQIGRGKNTPKFVKAVAEGTLPFRKTPANIMVRGYEYSPLGVASSLLNTIQAVNPNSEKTASDAIRSWSKAMTGSALLVAGFTLARMGILRGRDDDDDKKAAFDHLRGHQEYSIEIDGKSYTIDAFAPSCLPLLVGAEAARLTNENGWDVKSVEAAISNLADPMINMSMLQGVNDTLDNVKFADNSLVQLAELSAFNYLTQGMTNTLAGQLERTSEENRMTTYTDPESPLPEWLQKQIGKMSAKTPGWDYHQTEYLDAWGRKQSNGTTGERAARNLFAPWYSSEISRDPVENELERLYNDTKSSALLPEAYPPKDMTFDGNQRKATQGEKTRYQRSAGGAAHDKLELLFRSSQYMKMRDDERAAAIAAIYDYAREKGKDAAGADYDKPSWIDKSDGGVEKNAAFHGILQAAKQTISKDERGKKGAQMQAVLNRRLSDADTMQVFAQILGDSSTLGKVQELQGNKYDLETIVGYYNAANEEGEFWNPDKKKYTKKRSKSAMIQYMMENYGLSNAQATYMYYVFNPKQS